MKTLVLSALLLLSTTAVQAGPIESARGTQVSFSNAAGEHQCGGTAIGRRTVVTATHCMAPDVGIVRMDGKPVKLEVVHSDGRDNSLVYVDRDLPRVAKVGAPPQAGDSVFIWGSPHGMGTLVRRGHYAGILVHPITRVSYRTFDIEVINGDSGSGVFNSEGRLIGLVSKILTPTPQWRMMITPGFAFTKEQWKDIR